MEKKMTIKLFGIFAEKIGSRQIDIPFCNDLETLTQYFSKAYPDLNQFQFAVAVNREIVHQNCLLKNEDEIALLPPFSGG